MATTGEVTPPIIGIPLNGSRGTAAIGDTDGGRLDGDTVWDRAVGPMQFIPSTWAGSGADGNGDGIKDPNNIFDAALATAAYLCRAVPGSDLTSDADQRRAAFSYNHSSAYVDKVMRAAAALAAAATAGPGGAVLIVATGGPIQLATVGGITVNASLAPHLAQLLEPPGPPGCAWAVAGTGQRPSRSRPGSTTAALTSTTRRPPLAARRRPGRASRCTSRAWPSTSPARGRSSAPGPARASSGWQPMLHAMAFITFQVSLGIIRRMHVSPSLFQCTPLFGIRQPPRSIGVIEKKSGKSCRVRVPPEAWH